MKKSIFIASILLCTCFHQAKAQETPDVIVPGTYYQDNVINHYAGTWKWTSGTDTFTIVLVKKKLDLDDHSMDVLSGGYRYVKNGVEVINTLSDVNLDINDDNSPVASLESIVREGNELMFGFIDRGNSNRSGHVNVVITPTGNTFSMTWWLVGAGLRYQAPNAPPLPQGWSVPNEGIVLVKQ